jgi:DNA helicase HerA-like ATPase
VEVRGHSVTGELEASVDDLYRTHRSRKYAIGQIGSIVKIESGDQLVFGIVTSLRMVETDDSVTLRDRTESPHAKWIEIELFGQGRRTGTQHANFSFDRGISIYPLPGQPIFVADVEELTRIYAKPDKATIKIGSVAQTKGLPVHLLTDELLGKHCAVMGTTGAGKSCAVALLLQAILEANPFGHIILLDPHNEYPRAFPGKAELIDPTTLEIPHWLLNFDESVELFVGRTEYAATSQTNILKEAIIAAKRKMAGGANPQITVDCPVPYKIGDMKVEIERLASGLTESKKESHTKILNKIVTLKEDKRFAFLIRSDDMVADNLEQLVASWFRIPVAGKPLSIIDLSGVPSDVVDVVVSVLCRMIFDFTLWNPKRKDYPLLLVCEEAHRYAPRGDQAAFQPTKRAIARIAKEGRKYGVGLMLVTQRPSELAETILSQCNTIIALRMSNQEDQNYVKRALPDSVQSMVDTLPALRSREALVVGEGTTVPVRLVFDELPEERRPRSANIPFAQSWKEETDSKDIVAEAVRRWRQQDRS